jgi:anaerobic selenocysteine-containing dehydrogenase
MKRIDGKLEPVSWETAITEIGAGLKSIRKKNGPKGIGLYLGERAQRSARTMVRSLAFGVGSGTPHLFSEANLCFAPVLWATENMVGHAASLMSDLSRAHYVVLLGGDQRKTGWGPYSPGEDHEGWIQHSRKTKKTKVVVADPRKTELADTMDKHLPIRPGTESYLMLGMLTAIVQSGWTDDQFVRDYTADFETLQSITKNWEVEKFAALCGIEATELNGVALSFSRSAMALIHPTRNSFQNEAGALGAWAWLAIHAVTANILRPGGLFENKGIVDLYSILTQIRADKAPKAEGTDLPLTLMQAPGSAVSGSIHNGSLRALISVSGDPMGRLPKPSNTKEALDQLDLLVCIAEHHNQSTEEAHWVLPASLDQEQFALIIDTDSSNPPAWSQPDANPRTQSRPADAILADLYTQLKPGLRGSVWGRHLGLFAQYVARTDLEQWEQKLLSEHLSESGGKWSIIVDDTPDHGANGAEDSSRLNTRYLHLGDGDRSLWRPSTSHERINLVFETLMPLVQQLSLGEPPPKVIRTGQWIGRSIAGHNERDAHEQPFVHLHPDAGFVDGDSVYIRTEYGSCEATVKLDDRLRDDVIDIPFWSGSSTLNLLPKDTSQSTAGAMVTDGLAATVDRRES